MKNQVLVNASNERISKRQTSKLKKEVEDIVVNINARLEKVSSQKARETLIHSHFDIDESIESIEKNRQTNIQKD